MKQSLRFIIVLGMGLLMGCQTIEHRNETIKKNKLSVLTEESTEVLVSKTWIKKLGKGVGKKDPLLLIAQNGQAIVAADYEGHVYFVDKKSGENLWQVHLNHEISAGPTMVDGLIFLGSSNGDVIALDAESGQTKWQRALTSEVVAAPVASEGVVFIHSLDGGITALNAQTGRQLWRYSSESPSLILRRSAAPAISEERAVAGFANGKVVAFRRVDGDVEWTREVTLPTGHSEIQRMIDVGAKPVIAHDNVYVVSYQGKVACLTLQTGEVLWERDISSYAGLAVKGNQVFVAASNGEVWAFDAHNGATLWVQEALKGRRLSQPVTQKKWVVLGDDDGTIHWLHVENGRMVGRTMVDKQGVEAPVAVMGENVFVFGKGGRVTALHTTEKGQQGSLRPTS